MKATEGRLGRVFVLRLEEDDIIPNSIEQFAADKGIAHAQVTLVGGVGHGKVVVGPQSGAAMPPEPILLPIDGPHEVVGLGLLAPNAEGEPVLHVHAALGRAGHTLTGCLRPGVETWLVGEVIVVELLDVAATRRRDAATGFVLLEVDREA